MSETKMKNGQLTKNKSKATTINFNSIALLNVFNDAEGKGGGEVFSLLYVTIDGKNLLKMFRR